MSKRLLLLSSSRVHGGGYLDHAETAVRDFLKGISRVLFVPYALHDRDGYATVARQRLGSLGFEVESIHRCSDPRQAVEKAQAVFIGGGNTFRLLDALYGNHLVDAIRQRVEKGMPYMGASAGSNVAGPTIKTTNDMPIVQPPSFDALRLVPFQVNPHYLDSDPNSTHMGETRDQRLREYLEENNTPVIAIREAGMICVEGEVVTLEGSAGAKIFRRGQEPFEIDPGNLVEL